MSNVSFGILTEVGKVAVLVIFSFLVGGCGTPHSCPGHSLIHFLKEAVVLPTLVAVLVIASFLVGGCGTPRTSGCPGHSLIS